MFHCNLHFVSYKSTLNKVHKLCVSHTIKIKILTAWKEANEAKEESINGDMFSKYEVTLRELTHMTCRR